MRFREITLAAVASAGIVAGLASGQDDGFFGDLFRSSRQPFAAAASAEPSQRTFVRDNKKYVTAVPGDTFASLAKSLYGDETKWRLIYWANRASLPNPASAGSLFKPGEISKVFVVPPPSHVVPIYQLSLKGPEDITEKEAKVILEAMGLMDGKRTMDRALRGLKYGYTYTYKKGTLNDEAKGYLFREFNLMKKAFDRWGDYPKISAEATPQLYEKWIASAAESLTALPKNQRYALVKSLMSKETGRTHWNEYHPVMGSHADTGFGQFIPATAMAVGINPYDPEENIKGIALYMNTLIRTHGLKEGLAHYNGGNSPPARSYLYAADIMRGMKRYAK